MFLVTVSDSSTCHEGIQVLKTLKGKGLQMYLNKCKQQRMSEAIRWQLVPHFHTSAYNQQSRSILLYVLARAHKPLHFQEQLLYRKPLAVSSQHLKCVDNSNLYVLVFLFARKKTRKRNGKRTLNSNDKVWCVFHFINLRRQQKIFHYSQFALGQLEGA